MRKLIMLLSIFVIAFIPQAFAKKYSYDKATVQAKVDRADAVVMMFYADWCHACQILDPVTINAAKSYEGGNIEIVRLDFTDRDLSAIMEQAEKAEMLGMGHMVSLERIVTGYALIVVNGEVKSQIRAGHNEAMMHIAFDEALKAE